MPLGSDQPLQVHSDDAMLIDVLWNTELKFSLALLLGLFSLGSVKTSYFSNSFADLLLSQTLQ